MEAFRANYRLKGDQFCSYVVRRLFRFVLAREWLFNLINGVAEDVLADRGIARLYQWFGKGGSRTNSSGRTATPSSVA
ncbi:MAG: hypothetical protein FJ224_10905 [Lentisphaerae bacterium]|nr:hypothetical protein [Lentisphaerota bacterium]